MKLRCINRCKNGVMESTTTCSECKGVGYKSLSIGAGQSKNEKDKCQTCRGKGKIFSRTECEECNNGFTYICDFCGVKLDDHEDNSCSTCEENPIVIKLAQPLDQKYLDGKRALAAVIKSASQKGVFADIGLGFIGYFKSDFKYNVGEEIALRLKHPIGVTDRGNNKTVPVIPLRTKRFKIVEKHMPVRDTSIEALRAEQRGVGKVRAVVSNIFQIPRGPIIFDLIDENGDLLKVSAMPDNAPKAVRNTVVDAVVRYKVVNEQERAQVYNFDKILANDAIEFLGKLASLNKITRKSIDETEFYIESNVYDGLKENILKAAKRIRTAILRHQNIIIRYHSPCIDGTAGAYAIDHAIRKFLLSRGARRDEYKRVVRRLPQRNPFFEVREAARDLSFVLDDSANVFNLPLYILVDVGSSEESKAALQLAKSYGVDVIVVDHHLMFDALEDNVFSVLNPDIVEQNNNVTSGMLATELAKFIVPEEDMQKEIIQLAAVSGLSDRMEGDEISKYLELSDENEFDRNRIINIASALDYLTFGLRHMDGGEIVRNILGISGKFETNTALIENITPTAQSLFAKSLKIMKDNVEEETLANSTLLVKSNFEKFAPRFEYPGHSDLLSALHHNKRDEASSAVVTLGFGSDYCIIRSTNLNFNFTEFFEKISHKRPELGLTGSGHRSVGSIRFVSGYKEEVIAEIIKLLSE